MSIERTQYRHHQLRSEERKSTRSLLLKLIPLLRTELEGPGLLFLKFADKIGNLTDQPAKQVLA
jgi:hypothetical protein